ncbi:ABC transporter ATP-binding protein [Mameliella alba]|nr:ABC transporter ATP-binding protein [Mameliella alba]
MAQVEKTFHGGVIALRNMNLTVNEGDFVSLLGPSGCGKSTALKLVTGLMQPTSGRIDWAGEDGAGEKGAGDLGVVFQEPTLMPWARVMDNVYLPFRIRGVPFAEVRDEVLEVLRLVGLEKFQRAFPRELSGGMKMRVSIARALVTKPRLILMDEPFAALDEITRFKLNNDLLALREKIGCTVIFVTHSVFESVFLSDRVVVMAARPGRVIEELTVDAPYRRSEAFRTSAEYARYCRLASNALHRATGEAA